MRDETMIAFILELIETHIAECEANEIAAHVCSEQERKAWKISKVGNAPDGFFVELEGGKRFNFELAW